MLMKLSMLRKLLALRFTSFILELMLSDKPAVNLLSKLNLLPRSKSMYTCSSPASLSNSILAIYIGFSTLRA